MRGSILRAFLVVLLSSGWGLVVNWVSPRGLPFITPPKPQPKPEEIIQLDRARELWEGSLALFLDARAAEDYAAGHIANARSLPADQFEEHFANVEPMLTAFPTTVVYCDGTICDLSHRLQAQLRLMGYTNVFMMTNGWTSWSAAGLPTETSSQP